MTIAKKRTPRIPPMVAIVGTMRSAAIAFLTALRKRVRRGWANGCGAVSFGMTPTGGTSASVGLASISTPHDGQVFPDSGFSVWQQAQIMALCSPLRAISVRETDRLELSFR